MSKHRHPFGATWYVIPRPEVRSGQSPMVKEANYFCDQGGHLESWGESWIPVVADGLHHARLLGFFIGSGTPFPDGIGFAPPNRRTVKEIKDDGFDWKT